MTTRKEQIALQGEKFHEDTGGGIWQIQDFIAGAEWADQNPETATGEYSTIIAFKKRGDQIQHLEAMLAVAVEGLNHYAQEEQVLSGSDYQCAGTSSYRQAYVEDGGVTATETLAKIEQMKKEIK